MAAANKPFTLLDVFHDWKSSLVSKRTTSAASFASCTDGHFVPKLHPYVAPSLVHIPRIPAIAHMQ